MLKHYSENQKPEAAMLHLFLAKWLNVKVKDKSGCKTGKSTPAKQ